MKHLLKLCVLACMPFAANAAGTYYTGNYQSPQTRYNTKSYTTGSMTQSATYNRTYAGPQGASYNNTSYASTRPMVGLTPAQQARFSQNGTSQNQRTPSRTAAQAANEGFWLDAGVSYENAKWQFEMKDSGSILHYDDVSWFVLGMNAGYAFDMGSVGGEIQFGAKYGFQGGESTMVDDDITNGGYLVTEFVETDADGNITNVVGSQIGHAVSIGTSKGGNMYGFNGGFGITDMFQIGNLKFTPSIGYRYLKYKLETENNYGLSVDTWQCFTDDSGETQCDPILIFYDNTNGQAPAIGERTDTNEFVETGGYQYVDTAGTYYFEQPATSHSYEVAWAGPYLALDMDYVINQNNAVTGRLEFGLPSYKATGDQPYRHDWAHPKSVEDSAGIGSAFHFGAGMNWVTAITDAVSLSLGVTYDYYTVGDADAKTYINSDYYYGLYDAYLEKWGGDETLMLDQDRFAAALKQNIEDIEAECPGWVCKSNGEIESFYKSLGVRVGIFAKF